MATTVEDFRSVDHAVCVPVSDEQLRETVAAFLAQGMALGEQAVYFDDGTAEAVLERLADDDVAVDGPLRDGRLTIISAEETRDALRGPGDEIAGLVRNTIGGALGAGYPGVRVAGSLDHGLRRPSGESVAAYERMLDDLVRGRPARVLCIYDRVRYPDEVVEVMRDLHHTEVVAPAIYDDGLLRITATSACSARVAGEVDHSNRPRIRKLLESSLDRALRAAEAPRDITLDLSSLRFLDVAGAVGLVHIAEEFPSAHRLVLTGVRPRVQRVLDRCGAPFAAQLVVRPRVEPTTSTAAHARDDVTPARGTPTFESTALRREIPLGSRTGSGSAADRRALR